MIHLYHIQDADYVGASQKQWWWGPWCYEHVKFEKILDRIKSQAKRFLDIHKEDESSKQSMTNLHFSVFKALNWYYSNISQTMKIFSMLKIPWHVSLQGQLINHKMTPSFAWQRGMMYNQLFLLILLLLLQTMRY